MIPLTDVQERGVYRLDSRNLTVGVFNGSTGFIGIRSKFGDKYLFTEYHWDKGAPHGTVRPLELLCLLPDDIEPREVLDRDPSEERGEFDPPWLPNTKLFNFLSEVGKRTTLTQDKE